MRVALLVVGIAAALPAPARAASWDVLANTGVFGGTGDLPVSYELNTLVGARLRDPLGIGLVLAWRRSGEREFVIPAHGTRAGGTGTALEYPLTNALVDLLPFYAHVYVPLGEGGNSAMIGIGGGYQVAFIDADAFTTQTFGGWGGTVWVGGYRNVRSRDPSVSLGIGIEAAYDIGTVSSDTFDRALAIPVRQELDTAGWSVRVAIRISEHKARPGADSGP